MSQCQSSQSSSLTGYVVAFAAISLMSLGAISFTTGIYLSSFIVIGATAFLLALSGWLVVRNGQLLAASEERSRGLIDNALVGIFVYRDGKFQFVNKRFAEMLGYEPEELAGISVPDTIHPDDRNMVAQRMRTREAGENVTDRYELRFLTKCGETGWAEVWVRPVAGGADQGILVNVVDITERKEAERQLQVSEKKFRTFTEQSLHPIWVIQDGRIVYCNSALALYIGADSSEQAQGVELSEIVEAENWAEVETTLNLVISGKSQGERMVISLTPLPGEVRWHEAQFARIEYEGRPAVLADSQDITEIKLLMEELDAERLHDSLTGLYNRRYFNDIFLREVKHSDRYGTPLTLLMLDVDDFKAVNDAFGHAVGDRMLQAVAEVIRQHARGADIPIRFGGDEFLIVMPNTSWPDAEAITRRLAQGLIEYLQEQAEKGQLPEETAALVWLSGGAASYQHEANESLDDVLRRADKRMYEQKERNRAWRQQRSDREDDSQRRVG